MAEKNTEHKKQGSWREAADRLRALGALFTVLDGSADEAYADAALAAPATHARRRFELDVLTPAGAVSLLPVESLYKAWAPSRGACEGNYALGGMKHLYLGDSARHMRALLKRIEIEVPSGFAAMPDHLALLCELAFIYSEAENHRALASFLEGHFDWISAYAAELSERKRAFQDVREPSKRVLECIEAIDHGLMLLDEIEETVGELRKGLAQEAAAA